MDLLEISGLFGLPSKDSKVQKLLGELGLPTKLRTKNDETSLNVEKPENGFFLNFTDETFQLRKSAPVGSGDLLLTNVTVYCTPTGTFKAYAGVLPFGLTPADGRDKVLKKLGKADEELDWLSQDKWVKKNLWVFVQYTEDLQAIDNLSIQWADMKTLKSFAAGFLSTVTFHQGVIAVFYFVGAFPKPPFNMTPTQPLGVPAVISLAFFGGLWGIVIERFIRKYSERKQLFLWIGLGALGPTLIALAVVAPLKGAEFHPIMIPGGLIVNGVWGLGCYLILKLIANPAPK